MIDIISVYIKNLKFQMLQKLLRIIAMVLLIALIFSPIYSKYIRHYFVSFKLLDNEIDNITDIVEGSDNLCDVQSKIKIPSSNHKVQIIHIMSKNCNACIDDVSIWKEFPEILYKHLILNQKKPKVEVIHIIDTKDSKDILTELTSLVIGNDLLQNQLKTVNTSLCLGLITDDEIKAMNIKTLPTTMIIKDSNIYYALSRQVNKKDLEKFSTIISSLLK